MQAPSRQSRVNQRVPAEQSLSRVTLRRILSKRLDVIATVSQPDDSLAQLFKFYEYQTASRNFDGVTMRWRWV